VPAVKIAKDRVSSRCGTQRWYVWTRTSGGQRRERVGSYIERVLKDKRITHARNIAAKALALGVPLDISIFSNLGGGNGFARSTV
jgi:hypothetical protein